MKKQFYSMVAIGAILMGVPLFATPFYIIPDTIADFIKGFGVGIILASFFLGVWYSRKINKNKFVN